MRFAGICRRPHDAGGDIMPVTVRTFATSNEAAAALSSDRGARYLGGGTLVMRALNEGDISISTVVRATDRALTHVDVSGARVVIGAGVTFARILAERDLAFLQAPARSIRAPHAGPVDLESGPNGDLFYADFTGGTIRRIQYTGVVPPPPAGTDYLSDLTWTSETGGWGPVEKDLSNGGTSAGDGHAITLNGTTYAKGLGTHAVSDIKYALAGGCTRFRADVGVDDEVTSALASVVFQVFADGTKLYDSGVVGATTPTKSIDVDLTGKSQLQLVVDDAGDGIDSDHADWAAARIDCGKT